MQTILVKSAGEKAYQRADYKQAEQQFMNNLAALYRDEGRYAEAEPLYEKALSIFEDTFGKDHPSAAMALMGLGNLFQAQGRYPVAQTMYEKALAIKEQSLGSNHPLVAASRQSLAAISAKLRA